MPQAKRGSSSSSGSGPSSSRSARSRSASGGSTSKSSTRKTTGSASRSGTSPRAKSTTSRAKSSTTRAKSTSSGAKSVSSRAKSTGSSTRKTAAKATTRATAGADARLEAIAGRVRKLNERIIEAGREAGETTLTTYEKALKTIAKGIEQGPGRSDIDWLSNLATAQAKFLKDLTQTWTSAARNVIK